MTTQLDGFIGLAKETTYNTYVAPSSFLTFVEESLEQKTTFLDGTGMRPGRRTTTKQQRVIGKQEFTGDITVEATPAELGVLFYALFGSVTNTLLAGTSYQHLFTPAADYLPSFSIQKGVPPLGGAAQSPFSFTGMQLSSLALDAKQGAIPSVKTSWVGAGLSTAQSAASPVYPALNEEFSFVGGSIAIGGTVTAPTASTLATGATTVAQITDVSATFDNGFESGGFTLGAAGARSRPAAVLQQKISGSITAEFRDSTFWNYFTAGTPLALVLNYQGSAIDSPYYNDLQLYIPAISLEGETPKIQNNKIVTQSINFTALQDIVNSLQPYYVVLRNKVAAY